MYGLAFNTAKKANDAGGLAIAILVVLFLVALAFGIDCLIVWWAMVLWNGCLVAAVPALVEVSYWQMWGVYLLCGFLFRRTVTNTNTNSNE